jgi:hypothetical protein
MSKRQHHYRLTLEHLEASAPDQPLHEALQLDFTNHDDVFAIVQRVQAANFLPPEQAAELALGVKLLGNVLLANREHPLFMELGQSFKEFVQKLKAHAKPAAE